MAKPTRQIEIILKLFNLNFIVYLARYTSCYVCSLALPTFDEFLRLAVQG